MVRWFTTSDDKIAAGCLVEVGVEFRYRYNPIADKWFFEIVAGEDCSQAIGAWEANGIEFRNI